MADSLVRCPANPNYDWKGETLTSVFLKYLKSNGDAVFQIESETGKSQTFMDVYLKSIRTAQHMQKKGIKSSDIVVLCSQNRLESCIPLIACLFLGVKICSLDPSLPLKDCVHLLKLVDSKLIFCDEFSLDLIEKTLKNAGIDNEVVVYGETKSHTCFDEFIAPTGNEDEFEATKTDPSDTAIIFFSSGTTGLPKAICCTHEGLLSKTLNPDQTNTAMMAHMARTIHYYTTFYWISAVTTLIASIILKSTQILATKFEPEQALQLIEKYKVAFLFLTPYQVYDIMHCNKIEQYDLSSLQCLVLGGSAFGKEQHMALKKYLPKTLILITYALTETHGVVTLFGEPADFVKSQSKFSCAGKVFQGYTIKLVDPETNAIVGSNTEGEIRIKGNFLFKEYYKNPKATKDAFDEEGYFMTGDIGYYDDENCFYIVDRIKEMFKFQSWHIIPTELEAILLTHPRIKEAAVIGVPHEQDGDWPMACVVLKPGSQATEEEILAFFNDQVADRKKLRAGVKIMKELPYTPSGKLKRRDLRKEFSKN